MIIDSHKRKTADGKGRKLCGLYLHLVPQYSRALQRSWQSVGNRYTYRDSTVATAIRTIVVLLFSWLMVFVVNRYTYSGAISSRSWLFLILSGMATGASWLCYFKALQLGDINKVVPVDKSSVILTILLAFVLLHEEINVPKAIGVVLIGIGTYLMIERKKETANQQGKRNSWFLYAAGSAVFASLTSILG